MSTLTVNWDKFYDTWIKWHCLAVFSMSIWLSYQKQMDLLFHSIHTVIDLVSTLQILVKYYMIMWNLWADKDCLNNNSLIKSFKKKLWRRHHWKLHNSITNRLHIFPAAPKIKYYFSFMFEDGNRCYDSYVFTESGVLLLDIAMNL